MLFLEYVIRSIKSTLDYFQEIRTDGEILENQEIQWRMAKSLILFEYIRPFFVEAKRPEYDQVHYYEIFADSGHYSINGKTFADTPLIPHLRVKELQKSKPEFFFDSVNYYMQDIKKREILFKRVSSHKIPVTAINIRQSRISGFVDEFEKRKKLKSYTKNNTHLMLIDTEISWYDLERLLKSASMDIILSFTNVEELQSNIADLELLSRNYTTGLIKLKIENMDYPIMCISRHSKLVKTFCAIKSKLQKNVEIYKDTLRSNHTLFD